MNLQPIAQHWVPYISKLRIINGNTFEFNLNVPVMYQSPVDGLFEVEIKASASSNGWAFDNKIQALMLDTREGVKVIEARELRELISTTFKEKRFSPIPKHGFLVEKEEGRVLGYINVKEV